jgi:hypothetical protein
MLHSSFVIYKKLRKYSKIYTIHDEHKEEPKKCTIKIVEREFIEKIPFS